MNKTDFTNGLKRELQLYDDATHRDAIDGKFVENLILLLEKENKNRFGEDAEMVGQLYGIRVVCLALGISIDGHLDYTNDR